jgi:hypothetical protein
MSCPGSDAGHRLVVQWRGPIGVLVGIGVRLLH